jgi:butyrate kinase
MGFVILSIYPMPTSMGVAVFDDDAEIKRTELRFGPYGISETGQTSGQLSDRETYAEDIMTEWFRKTKPPDAVVGAAFMRSRRPSGLYLINDDLKKHLCDDYASARNINRSAILALKMAHRFSARPLAYVGLSNREVDAIYKISGIRGMTFNGLTRLIQIRDAIRKASVKLGIPPEKCSVIAAYFGDSISVCSQSDGRIRDFSDTFERGCFSIKHTGSMSAASIVRMAYSGMWSKADLLKNVYEAGGLSSYFPDAGLDEVISMMKAGDAYASMVLRAMINQIAAELSAHASALYGRVDAFVLLGEQAIKEFCVALLREKISWICDKIMILKAEDELKILAGAALEFLRGERIPAPREKTPEAM